MDAAEKYKNRYRAVIEYANGAMFNVAELDAWAASSKVPITFEKLLSFEGKEADYTPSRHYAPFEGLDIIIASNLVPETMDPAEARLQLIATHDNAEPENPVSRLRDLVMVRYDRLLLSAVHDGDLNLYDALTFTKIDVNAGRLRYDEQPEAYMHAVFARTVDLSHGTVTPEDQEAARKTLAQQFARLDHLAWALVILARDAPEAGEARYRHILSVTEWLHTLGLPFRHSNGLPASQHKGVPISGDDVRERQYLAVADVQAAATKEGFWPDAGNEDGSTAAQVRNRVTVADLAWRLASHRADDAHDSGKPGDSDGLERTIRIAMRMHGWQPDRVIGVIPQIAEMAHAGTITVRSMDGVTVNPGVEAISAKPDGWWLTADDAQHVVASLWQQVRRYTLTAVVDTIAKRVHDKDYLAEFALAKALRAQMQQSIDSGELPINERRNAEIWLNECDVDEWLARERKPYRLGLTAATDYEQAEMAGAGRLFISEFAESLAKETGIDAARWESTLVAEIKGGTLPLKNPRDLGDFLPYSVPKNLSTFYDRVDVADVNKLLDAHPEWRVTYRFPTQSHEEVPASGDASATPVPHHVPTPKADSGRMTYVPPRGIGKQQVITAFAGLHFDDEQWSKYLASPAPWLKACRVQRGSKSASKQPALWNPVKIAIALTEGGRSVPIKKLDGAFSVHKFLADWLDEWRDASEHFR